MTRRLVALTGIPGVGKSTFLRALSERLSFIPLQASKLLKKAREGSLRQTVAHDQLRYADLDENQRLMIQGLEESTTDAMPLVVLDSHSIIERDDDLVRIESAVFKTIGIRAMIFLQDDPAAIFARREQDTRRHRPNKDINALERMQNIARAHAEDICRTLQVPLYLATPQDVDQVSDTLRGVRDSRD